MKIALIRRRFSATGGAELYLQRLLGALAGAGHAAHLFAESWDQAPAGVTLHPVAAGGGRAGRARRFAEAILEAVAAQSFDCVFSLERTLRQDVYRAGDGVHRVWLRRRRQFAPWWRRPFIGLGAFHRGMLKLEAQTFDPRRTGRIIVNSEMVRREILGHFPFPEDRIHLVRNGIDVARFQSGRRAETRARFGVRDDEFLLLFAGSGWERKGLRYVLDAVGLVEALVPPGKKFPVNDAAFRQQFPGLAQYGGLKLLVAGKGDPPRRAPAGAIFAGALPDMENAYAAADLLVFPPIYEPSANVVIEALAAGLPVVTSACNGASEMVREGLTGAVLPNPSDVDSLVKAVDHWAGRRQRVREDHALLSLERNVAETLAVLEQAAREKSCRQP